MRAQFRRVAYTAGFLSALLGAAIAWLIAFTLYRVQRNRVEVGDPLAPPWVIILVAAVTVVAALGLAWWVSRRYADLIGNRTVQVMHHLTQRAEEFGSAAYTPESSGEDNTPAPLQSGIVEADTLSVVLDRNHKATMRALEAERSFAADASHQLRTPLSALLLRLEEIRATNDISTAHEDADIAIRQTERLAEEVGDLLNRTRAGHADGGRSASVDMVLTQVTKEWETAFKGENRAIRCTTEKGIIVWSSGSALSQVLNTLVENALTHGGGDVEVRARRSGPSAVIEVEDQGAGIPAQLAHKIFTRGATSGNGTGLGLGVARETAESFGGRLELVENEPAVFALFVTAAPVR